MPPVPPVEPAPLTPPPDADAGIPAAARSRRRSRPAGVRKLRPWRITLVLATAALSAGTLVAACTTRQTRATRTRRRPILIRSKAGPVCPVHLASRCPQVTFLAGNLPIAKISTALLCRLIGMLIRGSRAAILMGIGIPPMSLSATESCICVRRLTMTRKDRIHIRLAGSVSMEILRNMACTWFA